MSNGALKICFSHSEDLFFSGLGPIYILYECKSIQLKKKQNTLHF